MTPIEGILALRRRSVWEAVDSGLLIWRKNFFYFLPFFALPFWTIAFATRFLPEFFRFFSWIVLWYLKPFFDRFILHVISVRFFEGYAGLRRIFRGLGKSLVRSLPGDLLWRRLNPWRAVMLPVRVLEGLTSRRMRRRKKSLVGGGVDFCIFLTGWGFLLEWVLLAGEFVFFLFSANIIRPDYFDSFEDFFVQGELFFFSLWCVNLMLVESIYVCMGFALYINSRVETEGWDLEILFRRLAKKYRPKAALSVFCVFLLMFPVCAYAETAEDTSAEVSAEISPVPLESLGRILESEDFGGTRDGWAIGWKDGEDDDDESLDFSYAPWVKNIRQVFAFVLRIALVAAIAAMLVLLILYLKKIPLSGGSRGKKYTQTVFAARGESPASLFERAFLLHQAGSTREAWAACLAGILSAYSSYRGLSFPREATEYDCLSLVRKSGLDEAPFVDLVKTWIVFAYGGTYPAAGAFERALDFGRSLVPADASDGAGRG
jgi:hypothetical protein